ncbi:MAG TPA: sulfite exporter TauE/SafE family protein [Pseudolabrys sp.]|nr:sulfite exporter TauE/SafE family protein [Pseudolabrys sp.]
MEQASGRVVTSVQALLSVASGSLVGLTLGLVGGGGSILAVPLLVYVVGVHNPHVAIGTSALAVAVSALVNLAGHARGGHVKWRCAAVFAIAGVAGATIGAQLGKMVDGGRLLALFGLLMIMVGGLMLRPRQQAGNADVRLTRSSAPRLLPPLIVAGFAVGLLSGFFGIGGGFLIVPGLMGASGMPIINAIASSLVAVASFGATTAASYAISDLIDWPLAALFIAGGALGGLAGVRLAGRLAARKHTLTVLFASLVIGVGCAVAASAFLR